MRKRDEKGRNPGDTGFWPAEPLGTQCRKDEGGGRGVCIWMCWFSLWDQVGMVILHMINRSEAQVQDSWVRPCIMVTFKSPWRKIGRLKVEDRLQQRGVGQEPVCKWEE